MFFCHCCVLIISTCLYFISQIKSYKRKILVWTFSPFSDLSYFLCLVLSSPVPAGCQCNGILWPASTGAPSARLHSDPPTTWRGRLLRRLQHWALRPQLLSVCTFREACLIHTFTYHSNIHTHSHYNGCMGEQLGVVSCPGIFGIQTGEARDRITNLISRWLLVLLYSHRKCVGVAQDYNPFQALYVLLWANLKVTCKFEVFSCWLQKVGDLCTLTRLNVSWPSPTISWLSCCRFQFSFLPLHLLWPCLWRWIKM